MSFLTPSKPQNFSVVFRDNDAYREHSLGSNLQLDGSLIGGKVLRSLTRIGDPPNVARDRTVVQNGQTLSVTTSRPFVFSKLELTGILSHATYNLY